MLLHGRNAAEEVAEQREQGGPAQAAEHGERGETAPSMPEMPEMNGMNVRMNGKKRPRNTASGPHFSIMPSVLARRSGVIALTLPDR